MTVELVCLRSTKIALARCDGEEGMWVLAKQRKPKACELCGKTIEIAELSWRVVNQSRMYRQVRVCRGHWVKVPRRWKTLA